MTAFLIAIGLCALAGLFLDWGVAWAMGTSLASQSWHFAVAGAIGGTIGIGLASDNSRKLA